MHVNIYSPLKNPILVSIISRWKKQGDIHNKAGPCQEYLERRFSIHKPHYTVAVGRWKVAGVSPLFVANITSE